MKPLIVLDAGHGGQDFGAVAGERMEKRDALKLAEAVQAQLERAGCAVLMTRHSDVAVSPNMRVVLANGTGADLLVSLHRSPLAGERVQVWANRDAQDGAIVEELFQGLSRLGLSCESRARGDEGCHLLQRAAMPAIRIVLGSLTGKEENRLLDQCPEDCAGRIAEAVCRALGFSEERSVTASVSQRI